MNRLLAGLALITLIGTILTTTTANAASKWNTHDDDSITSAEIRLGVHQDLTETRRELRAERRARHDRILERREREAATAWTPAPEPTYQAYPEYHGCLSASEVGALAAGAGFPADLVPTMVTIAARESGLCPGATNPVSGACGLWQIYPAMPGCTDPERNAAYAYSKYVNAGYSLSPWAMTAP